MNHRPEAASSESSAAPSALQGIRVIDMSRVMAGPSAAQILADLGADVIKIERPGAGDDSRAWGPPFLADAAGAATSESAYFSSANRGKRSITIDVAAPAGQDIVRRLAAMSDVVIENFKVATLDRYGLGYAALSALNPRLIYCSITGFGHTGPYKSRPGYDTIMQAMGGLMSVTGHADGRPGAGPIKSGVAVTDVMTGLYASIAILAALQYRNSSGKGQHIDLALLDVQVASLVNIGMNYLASGKVPARVGNRLPTLYPSDAFRCADGYMMLIVGNDRQFERFCKAAGIPGVATDPRFVSNALRLRHADDLAPLIEVALRKRNVGEWIALLEEHGVACGPINDLAQVFDDPQVRAREMVVTLDHPLAGKLKTIANPIHFSDSKIRYGNAPPTLGQHTASILHDLLGIDHEEIGRLAESGVI